MKKKQIKKVKKKVNETKGPTRPEVALNTGDRVGPTIANRDMTD